MSENCFNLAIIFYFVTLVTVLTKSSRRFIRIFAIIGGCLHALGVLLRGVQIQHPPFTTTYEVIVLLMFFVIIRWQLQENVTTGILRPFILFFVIITMVTLQLLPPAFRATRPAPPALQSPWIYIHIPAYLLGYMALFFACFYAFNILLSARADNSPEIMDLGRRLNREAKLAFFGLNVGLITGAIWGFVSWGNYWSWDSKEVWALINLLLLGGYFHLEKPRNYKKALLIVGVTLSVIFTLVGVSYLMSGLHSYR